MWTCPYSKRKRRKGHSAMRRTVQRKHIYTLKKPLTGASADRYREEGEERRYATGPSHYKSDYKVDSHTSGKKWWQVPQHALLSIQLARRNNSYIISFQSAPYPMLRPTQCCDIVYTPLRTLIKTLCLISFWVQKSENNSLGRRSRGAWWDSLWDSQQKNCIVRAVGDMRKTYEEKTARTAMAT